MNGTFSVNGRTYALRFTVNNICCLEEAMGKGLSALLSGSLSGIRALLWCGLMSEGVEQEEAGQLMEAYLCQGGSLKELSDLLARAMEDAGFFPCAAKGTAP